MKELLIYLPHRGFWRRVEEMRKIVKKKEPEPNRLRFDDDGGGSLIQIPAATVGIESAPRRSTCSTDFFYKPLPGECQENSRSVLISLPI